jgi:16S rRNA (uracil1498-N3)-methyltransferase
MQLFYNSGLESSQKSFTFDKEESAHIVKVLRKQVGDILYVTNGLGFLFKTEIHIASANKCVVTILSFEKKEAPNYSVHLAVAPTKMNERFEWFLEKATEIGCSEITPIFCDHSERKIIKLERFEKVVVAAMKQSLHTFVPKLNDAIAFTDFIKLPFNGQKFIAHCEETKKQSLKELVQPQANVLILIGPEGDFSPKEIELALQNNFIPVSLGKTRLRTETAAIVACHSVAFVNE